MRVKRYVVDTMPEALQHIRSDLGHNAVILNTREMKSGGFLGLFGKKKIEVVAATDGQEQVAVARSPDEPVLPAKTRQEEDAVHGSIKQEIQQLKQLIWQMTSEAKRAAYPTQVKLWEYRLQQHEFKPELVTAILSEVVERFLTEHPQATIDDLCEEDVVHYVKAVLQERLEQRPIQGIDRRTTFVQFIGPTGVGKTTTIAKLAAEEVLTDRAEVGFITSDTYRIAAVEQLRTYANILNVPLEVVNSPQDLPIAHEKLGNVQRVFMDTAGRNFRNELFVSEMSSMLQHHEHHEIFLVLSLTMKYEDMRTVVRNFSHYKIDKVLFTKLDETGTVGPIFNLLDEFDLQLSYLTTGQNVPDDICKLSANIIIDRLLEGDLHA